MAPRYRPPRVLHLVDSLDVGGVQVGVLNLLSGLARLGYEQAICCLEGEGPLSVGVPASIPVWVCGGQGRPSRYAPVLRAAGVMHTFRPDVVHARNCGAWLNGGVSWLLAACPGRLAFSIHGLDWTGPLPKRRALLCRMLARVTTGLAAVSEATAQQFSAATCIAPRRFTVLHSSIDTHKFQPRTRRHFATRSSTKVILGCVARLAQQKGHDTLIRAFAAAQAQSRIRLELRLFGDGIFNATLQALVRSLGIGASVKFFGQCSDVPDQLGLLDIFVLASQQEGRPTSIMEAMGAGLPVIATRVGAVPDLIVNGESGLIVEPDDVQGLARAMLALVKDAPLRKLMGEIGRVQAVERFSLDSMIATYDAFYMKIAGKRLRNVTGDRSATPRISG